MHVTSIVFVFCFGFYVSMVYSQTDLTDCVCKWCDEMTSVGKVLNNTCFYISVNDLIYYNNYVVGLFSPSVIPNKSVAEGIITQLTAEFYNRFRFNHINMNFTGSDLFNYSQGETLKCPVLDIPKGSIFDGESMHCPPFPSVLNTNMFSIKDKLAYSLDRYEQCQGLQDSIAVKEDKCFYFIDDTQQCNVATITSLDEFEIFQQFVLNKSISMNTRVCAKSNHFADCMFGQYNKVYNMFIIYLNVTIFDSLESTPAFLVIGNETGFYHVDVMRRKLEYAKTYEIAVSKLKNDRNLKHFCEGSPIPSTPKRVHLTPITRRTVATTVETLTKRPIIKNYNQNDDRNVATATVFVLTGVLTVFTLLGLIIFRFREALMDFFFQDI